MIIEPDYYIVWTQTIELSVSTESSLMKTRSQIMLQKKKKKKKRMNDFLMSKGFLNTKGKRNMIQETTEMLN